MLDFSELEEARFTEPHLFGASLELGCGAGTLGLAAEADESDESVKAEDERRARESTDGPSSLVELDSA